MYDEYCSAIRAQDEVSEYTILAYPRQYISGKPRPLELNKNRFSCSRVHLIEQSRVEIVGACEGRNTQQRCSPDKQKWAHCLIQESTGSGIEIQD